MVERLSPAHAAEYRALMLKAYEQHPDAFTSTAAERAALPLRWWEARLADGLQTRDVVLGVRQAGALVGAVGVAFGTRQKTQHKSSLFGMYVAERARRQGHAERLLQAALEQAERRLGVRLIQLTVTQGNKAAQTLYERAGFIVFGIEPQAIALPEGYADKVYMWREVKG